MSTTDHYWPPITMFSAPAPTEWWTEIYKRYVGLVGKSPEEIREFFGGTAIGFDARGMWKFSIKMQGPLAELKFCKIHSGKKQTIHFSSREKALEHALFKLYLFA